MVYSISYNSDHKSSYSNFFKGNSAAKANQFTGDFRVNEETFGNVYTTFLEFDKFKEILKDYAGSLRWPGGTLSENNTVDYSLQNPDIWRNNGRSDRPGLTELLKYSNEEGKSFSMMLPIQRYIEDRDYVQATNDVKKFITNLLDGRFGKIPEKGITLEIGNENAGYAYQYGKLANMYLSVINDYLNKHNATADDYNLTILVQMGSNGGGRILRSITDKNFKLIDGVITHKGLVSSDKNFDYRDMSKAMQAWAEKWDKVWENTPISKRPELKFMATAWAVGKDPDGKDRNMDNLAERDIGARQAGATISVFSKMIALGVDSASLWGVQNLKHSYFWYKGETVSHGGHAFRLMAESLIGTELVGGKVSSTGQWQKTASNYDVISYKDNAKMVIFLKADDIAKGGLDVFLKLDGFKGSYAWVESITTKGEVSSSPSARLYEEAEITRKGQSFITIGDDTRLKYHFTEDYETVRIIISKENPKYGSLYLWGTSANNKLIGGFSSDKLEGNNGNDTLYGREGNDYLYGGNGNDVIYAGGGRNYINGGAGTDILSWQGAYNSVSVNLGNGKIIFQKMESKIVFGSIENLVGGNRNDYFTGNSKNNVMSGRNGDDRLSGMAGHDTLIGGYGQDKIFGGSGNDRISGGNGADYLSGGLGNDTFVFQTRFEGGDKISDFGAGVGNNDRIQIDAKGFGLNFKSGVLDAKYFQVRNDNHAQDFDDRFIFRKTDATLWFDSNGKAAGGLTMIADFQDNAVVTHSDIIII